MLNRDPKTHTRHLSDEEIKLVAAYAAKYGGARAGRHFNIAASTAYRALRLTGVPVPPSGCPRKFSPADLKRIAIHSAKHGNTQTQIDLGVSVWTVSKAMALHGVKPRKNGRPSEYTTTERQAWIQSARKDKLTPTQTAQRFSIPYTTIRREFIKQGMVKNINPLHKQ